MQSLGAGYTGRAPFGTDPPAQPVIQVIARARSAHVLRVDLIQSNLQRMFFRTTARPLDYLLAPLNSLTWLEALHHRSDGILTWCGCPFRFLAAAGEEQQNSHR